MTVTEVPFFYNKVSLILQQRPLHIGVAHSCAVAHPDWCLKAIAQQKIIAVDTLYIMHINQHAAIGQQKIILRQLFPHLVDGAIHLIGALCCVDIAIFILHLYNDNVLWFYFYRLHRSIKSNILFLVKNTAALQRLLQPFRLQRLQQIVRCIQLIAFDCKVITRSEKDQLKVKPVLAQTPHKLHAITRLQIDIHKDNVSAI